MSPIVWKVLTDKVPDLTSWLWENGDKFLPSAEKMAEFARTTITNPNRAVSRIGSALVFGKSDGGEKILGFIEQTSPRIDAIHSIVTQVQAGQQGMLASLDSLQVGQHALTSSLASLQNLSMVSLGFTAVLPIVLNAQFSALNKRVNVLIKAVHALNKKFTAARVAQLKTGVDMLELAMDSQLKGRFSEADDRYNNSLRNCLESVHYFYQLVGDELDESRPNRQEVRILARHLSVATLSVASCHIGLDDDQQAINIITSNLSQLKKATRWVFADTVEKDPSAFLTMPVGQNRVTLAFMSELYQQAKIAGAIDTEREYDAASWFEEHQEGILSFTAKQPFFGKSGRAKLMRAELIDAISSIEEVNRIQGLERLTREVKSRGGNRELMGKVREAIKNEVGSAPQRKDGKGEETEDGSYFIWAFKDAERSEPSVAT